MNTGLNTRVIHHGDSFAGDTGTVMPPIFPTSTFAHGNAGGFDYTRSGNPNFRILDSVLASVEGCAHATVFASGVSAITAVVSQLKQGDLVLCEENLYGCTVRLFEQVFAKFGLKTAWVDFTQPAALEQIQAQTPAMVWLESPTNPLLKVIDLEAVCAITQPLGIPVVVDNTFATPYLQNPLALGADVVLHSMTKYLAGHSDVVAGCLIGNDPELRERYAFNQNSCGGGLDPFSSFLVMRGTKTLAVRMERHCSNARAIAEFLEGHAAVETVHYPGLESHPQSELCARQMRDAGGMVSVELKGGLEAGAELSKRSRLFILAESLGGVESLIEVPPIMTHASIPAEERRASGMADGLVRLSVGIENVNDLIADLDQALSR